MGAIHPSGDKEWFDLRPAFDPAARVRPALIAGGAWEALFLFLLIFQRGGHAWRGYVFGVGLLAGLVPLVYALRLLLRARVLSDTHFTVDCREFVVGQSFRLKVRQKGPNTGNIKALRIGLQCLETIRGAAPPGAPKEGGRNVALLEKWANVARAPGTPTAAAGRPRWNTTTFTLPPGHPASSPLNFDGSPLIHWNIRVVATPEEGSAYEADFPIRVYLTPQPTSASDAFMRSSSSLDLAK